MAAPSAIFNSTISRCSLTIPTCLRLILQEPLGF